MEAELAASPDERFRAYGLIAANISNANAGVLSVDQVDADVEVAREVFERLGDERGLAISAWLEWGRNWFLLQTAAATTAALKGATHAGAAGDFVLARSLQHIAQTSMAVRPAHVDEAMTAAEAMLAEAAGVGERSDAERVIGKLLAIRGEIEAARESVRRSVEGNREAGKRVEAAAGAQTVSFVEIRAGDHAAAEQALRDGIAELGRLGALSYRGTAELMLADVLADQGQHEEAERLCAAARETVNADDLVDVITLDALQGFLAARRGELDAGESLGNRAAQLAAQIDMYETRRAHTTGRPGRSSWQESGLRRARRRRRPARSMGPKAMSSRPRGPPRCSSRCPARMARAIRGARARPG